MSLLKVCASPFIVVDVRNSPSRLKLERHCQQALMGSWVQGLPVCRK